MPYYANSPFPFWDFVASSTAEHPFFAAYNQGPPPYGPRERPSQGETNTNNTNAQAPNSEQPHPHHHHHHNGPPHAEGGLPFRGRGGPGGPCGPGGRHHRRGGPGGCGFGGRRHGGPPRSWPWGNRGPQDFNDIADLARAFFGGDTGSKDTDFSPAVDLFNTATHFVLHASLPGAKKEDISVDWDVETKTLKVAGVVYRPNVDEEMLKTLIGDERKVGFFERKIHLDEESTGGSKVDEEADITAKLDDGVLVVRVPKVVEKPIEPEEKGDDADMSETVKGDAEPEEDETEYVRVEVE